jgi:hypothetical protein
MTKEGAGEAILRPSNTAAGALGCACWVLSTRQLEEGQQVSTLRWCWWLALEKAHNPVLSCAAADTTAAHLRQLARGCGYVQGCLVAFVLALLLAEV